MSYYPVEDSSPLTAYDEAWDGVAEMEMMSGVRRGDGKLWSQFGPVGSATLKMRREILIGGDADCVAGDVRLEEVTRKLWGDSSCEFDRFICDGDGSSIFRRIVLPNSHMSNKASEDPVLFERSCSSSTDCDGFKTPRKDDRFGNLLSSSNENCDDADRNDTEWPSMNRFTAPENNSNLEFILPYEDAQFPPTETYEYGNDNSADLQALASTLEAIQVFSVRNDFDGATSNFRLTGLNCDEFHPHPTHIPTPHPFHINTNHNSHNNDQPAPNLLTFEESFGAVSTECDRVVRIVDIIKDFSETLKNSSNDIDHYHIDNALVRNVLFWLGASTQRISTIMQRALFPPPQTLTLPDVAHECNTPAAKNSLLNTAAESHCAAACNENSKANFPKLTGSKAEKSKSEKTTTQRYASNNRNPQPENAKTSRNSSLTKTKGRVAPSADSPVESCADVEISDEWQAVSTESRMNASLLDSARAKTFLTIKSEECQDELHRYGRCKPCAFCYNKKKGCKNGDNCKFCHHEDHGKQPLKQWKKQQQKQQLAVQKHAQSGASAVLSRSVKNEASGRLKNNELQLKNKPHGVSPRGNVLADAKTADSSSQSADSAGLPWIERISKNSCHVDSMSSMSTNYVESDSSFSLGARELSYNSLISRR